MIPFNGGQNNFSYIFKLLHTLMAALTLKNKQTKKKKKKKTRTCSHSHIEFKEKKTKVKGLRKAWEGFLAVIKWA